jgi:hypothetical protein
VRIRDRYRISAHAKDEALLRAIAMDGAQLAQQLQALAQAARARPAAKLPAQGIVMDTTKPFVPHDVRIAKLLGTPRPP